MEQPRRRVAARRAALATAVVAVAVAVVVVATGGDDGAKRPPPVRGTPAQAVAAVEAFQRALVARDFATICDGLFSERARAAAGGDNCQSVLAQATAHVARPSVQIRSVVLASGGTAAVGVVAGSATDGPAPDIIRLVRERGRFRIASAGNAARRRR
jgi:hypothetical protein